MKKIKNLINRKAVILGLEDIVIFKICAVSFGVLLGLFLPIRNKKTLGNILGITFITSYIYTVFKFFKYYMSEQERELYNGSDEDYEAYDDAYATEFDY